MKTIPEAVEIVQKDLADHNPSRTESFRELYQESQLLELVRCQCGSLAVIETPAYGGARYKCDECGADWISSAAATAAANKEASA
jgi:DNA-directed RNA polymerase subunit RPC12/RpoP